MRAFIFSLLFFILSQNPLGVHAQCSYYDPISPDPYVVPTCGDSIYADPTDVPNLPAAGTKELTATFIIKITDLCTNTPPITVYSLKAYTGSTFKTVYEIKANSLTSYNSYITDTVGTQELSQITTGTTNTYLAVAVSFDLANNKVIQSWATTLNFSTVSTMNVNFGSWIFKANPNPYLMYFAVDTATTKYTKGSSEKMSFSFTYTTNLFPYLFGSPAPTRLGSYAMLENTGHILTDTGTLGAAYFGSSTAATYDPTYAPSWTAMGVLFTNREQYIVMPSTLMFKSTNALVTASVSITFTIRLDELKAGTILTRVSTTDEMVMALKINAYGKLQSVMSDFAITTSQTGLKVDEWTQVSVFYMYSEGRVGASISLDETLVTPDLETTPLKAVSSFTEAFTDTFKIGGFKGSIRNFAVYGPGSPRILTSKCSTCALDMGATTAACISPKCASNQYVSGQTCQPCSSTCATCAGAGTSGCLTCTSPKVLSDTNTCDDPPTTTPGTGTGTPGTGTGTGSNSGNGSGTNSGSTSTTTTSNIKIDVETGKGFDVDVYVSIVVGVLATGAVIGLVVRHYRKKAKEEAMHDTIPSTPGMRDASTDLKTESFY